MTKKERYIAWKIAEKEGDLRTAKKHKEMYRRIVMEELKETPSKKI